MSDVFADVPAISPTDPVLRRNKLSDEKNLDITADLENGLEYRQIAHKHGVGLGTVARVAAKLDTYEHAARKYMAARGLQLAEDWLIASGEAAKKGNHLPAKEALLHLHVIDPIAVTPTSGITIIVGDGRHADGQAQPLPTITVQPTEPKALTGSE